MATRKGKLDREMILTRAGEILREHGPQGFGLRLLASSLDVSAPALYVYFESKQDLIEQVISRITDSVDVASFATERWDVALRAWGVSYYEIVSANPTLVGLISQLPGRRPEFLQRATRIQDGLTRGGWGREDATQISWMVRYLVLGASVTLPETHYSADATTYDDSYGNLDHVPAMLASSPTLGRDVFELGLDLLVHQLRSVHPRLPRETRAPAVVAG